MEWKDKTQFSYPENLYTPREEARPLTQVFDWYPADYPHLVSSSETITRICDRLGLPLAAMTKLHDPIPERYTKVPDMGGEGDLARFAYSFFSPLKEIAPYEMKSGYANWEKYLEELASDGNKVLLVKLDTLASMYEGVAEIGKRYGAQDMADQMIEEYQDTITAYQKKIQDTLRVCKRPRVLAIQGTLSWYWACTSHSYMGRLLNLAGAINLADHFVEAGETCPYEFKDIEEQLAFDPDVIFLTDQYESCHSTRPFIKKKFHLEFLFSDAWKNARAVRQGNVYWLDGGDFGSSASLNWQKTLNRLYSILYEGTGDEFRWEVSLENDA